MESMERTGRSGREMIAREKKLVAIEYHNEAWADEVSLKVSDRKSLLKRPLRPRLPNRSAEAGDSCALG